MGEADPGLRADQGCCVCLPRMVLHTQNSTGGCDLGTLAPDPCVQQAHSSTLLFSLGLQLLFGSHGETGAPLFCEVSLWSYLLPSPLIGVWLPLSQRSREQSVIWTMHIYPVFPPFNFLSVRTSLGLWEWCLAWLGLLTLIFLPWVRRFLPSLGYVAGFLFTSWSSLSWFSKSFCSTKQKWDITVRWNQEKSLSFWKYGALHYHPVLFSFLLYRDIYS